MKQKLNWTETVNDPDSARVQPGGKVREGNDCKYQKPTLKSYDIIF